MLLTTLIIGLGNPGEEFTRTRHNAGRVAIDTLAKHLGAEWKDKKSLFAEVAQIKNKRANVILAKPDTMMNNSGRAVAALVKKYKTKPDRVLVAHDDIDIPLGTYKLSFSKHSAGHKGVESVTRALKTKGFWRLRIGIHPPNRKKKVDAMALILKKFTEAEDRTIKKVIQEAVRDSILPMIGPTG